MLFQIVKGLYLRLMIDYDGDRELYTFCENFAVYIRQNIQHVQDCISQNYSHPVAIQFTFLVEMKLLEVGMCIGATCTFQAIEFAFIV